MQQAESTVTEITDAAVKTLANIDCDATPEQVCLAIQKIEAMADAAREAKRMMDEALYDWLIQNPGSELHVGTKKYYIGTTVTKKANDAGDALNALFEATGGDFQAVAKCISAGSSAWKFAQCKQVLGEEVYRQQFTEIVKKDVKGETVKQVKSVDTRFLQ